MIRNATKSQIRFWIEEAKKYPIELRIAAKLYINKISTKDFSDCFYELKDYKDVAEKVLEYLQKIMSKKIEVNAVLSHLAKCL
jgi:hypothetical protein